MYVYYSNYEFKDGNILLLCVYENVVSKRTNFICHKFGENIHSCKNIINIVINIIIMSFRGVCLFVCLFFYGISTFVGYLMPYPFLYK